ncbi:hypothetical protein COOONC_02816 [Cooperia oncophora]
MCGIWAVIGEQPTSTHRQHFMRIVGRGPDLTVIQEVQPGVYLGFHRLAIVMATNSGKDVLVKKVNHTVGN